MSESGAAIETVTTGQTSRWRMMRAVMAKDWLEHRWRFALSTVVLSGLLAGLLRAQIIPYREAALLIYWPVGVMVVIFLAMGGVSAERGEGAWGFLVAQPIRRASLLRGKWAFGAMQIVGIIAIATLLGALAMWSRGFEQWHLLNDDSWSGETETWWNTIIPPVTRTDAVTYHPIVWLLRTSAMTGVTLLCLYTPLMLLSSRYKSEAIAGLFGLLWMILIHIWLVVILTIGVALLDPQGDDYFFPINPLSPLLFAFIDEGGSRWIMIAAAYLLTWVVLPLCLARFWIREVPRS